MIRTTPITKVDILVVGGGPAGIAAASTLSRSGATVRLLDRHAAPGRKACAGGLTREAVALAESSGAGTGAEADRFHQLGVRSPLGETVLDSPDPAPILETIERPVWQMTRIRELQASGIEVRLGERLVGLEQDVAVTDRGRVRFGVLVGADGAGSRVRRAVGLPPLFGLVARQVRVPRERLGGGDVRRDIPTVWFDAGRMRSGYGWSFPFGDEMRLGWSVLREVMGRGEAKRGFLEWLGRLGLDARELQFECATIPCAYQGHRFGRIFLAGDAAGVASPVTGEGIAQALISGQEVAREILDKSYRSRIIPDLGKRHRRTAGFLNAPGFDRLLTLAPLLLQISPIRRAALDRFVTGTP